jgi:hypothetical protein
MHHADLPGIRESDGERESLWGSRGELVILNQHDIGTAEASDRSRPPLSLLSLLPHDRVMNVWRSLGSDIDSVPGRSGAGDRDDCVGMDRNDDDLNWQELLPIDGTAPRVLAA